MPGKKGTPSHRRGKGAALAWLRSYATWTGEDCLIFPFCRNGEGYGTLGVNGKVKKANRVMCELAHGPAPTPRHMSAHSCGNGHGGCVHPGHLSWKTPAENEQDKKAHGTHGGGRGNRSILTPAQVLEIRASKGVITAAVLGKKFGLTRAGVRYWQDSTHLPDPSLTSSEIARKANQTRRERALQS